MLGSIVRKPSTLFRSGRIGHNYFSTSSSEAKDLTLYQYAICPFCNIVKSVLHYSKLPYKAIEVNPLSKAEIKWSKDYTKVPIASIGDQHYFGSDDIVKGLLEFQNQQKFAENKWTKYATDELAPLLYPNLCNTLGNSFQAFNYVHSVPTFTTLQRMSIQSVGSFAMYMAASKIKKKRDITDEKQALKDALVELEDALTAQQFLSLGDEPNIGDLYVYGVLRGLEGLQVHQEVVGDNKQISMWYERMRKMVEEGALK